MASTVYGYVSGPRMPTKVKLDSSTSTVVVGDFLTLATAGYYKQASAGDEPHAVAMQASAAPSADGGITILADVSTLSVYRYPAASGSVTQALVGKKCDVGGAQSVDIAASVDGADGDGSLYIREVDTANSWLFVTLNSDYAGV